MSFSYTDRPARMRWCWRICFYGQMGQVIGIIGATGSIRPPGADDTGNFTMLQGQVLVDGGMSDYSLKTF